MLMSSMRARRWTPAEQECSAAGRSAGPARARTASRVCLSGCGSWPARLPPRTRGCQDSPDERHHLGGEPLHLLVLRAELEQQQVDSGPLEFRDALGDLLRRPHQARLDRKSTRLNSSHLVISYAVFCLKKKKKR